MTQAAAAPEAQQLSLLGVRVDAITMRDAIEQIVVRAKDVNAPPVYVVKPYVEFFTRAGARDRELINQAWLSLPDGVALQWAATYLGTKSTRLLPSLFGIMRDPKSIAQPIPEKFAGATFTWQLLERCRDEKLRVVLIGSPKKQPIRVTADFLRQKLPGLEIADAVPSPAAGAKMDSLIARLRNARADVVLVGLGYPRQERLMAALVKSLPHGVLIGEGGTFDYREFGGTIARAPKRMRDMGLEWLWRLGQEPSRLRRQTAIPRFIWRVHRSRNRN